MNLLVKRIALRPTYTIGKLYIDGQYFCDTLEDTDRGLKDSMSLEEIKRIKIKDKTAIPKGEYKVTMNVFSPSFGNRDFYKLTCNGRLPRLINVKGYDGVLMHVGDGIRGAELTSGCILIGKNKIVGCLLNGKETFKALYNKLKGQKEISIKIE